MNRTEKRMLIGLAGLIIALAVFEASIPRPVDWSPSFSRHHTRPYGAKLVYERLTDLFPAVVPVTDPPYLATQQRLSAGEADIHPVNHLYINNGFQVERGPAENLLALVEAGDHLLIAAEWFAGAFADTLRLDTDRLRWGWTEDTTEIRFLGDPRIAPGVFRFSRGFPGAHFTRYDSSRTRVLAVDGASNPVLLEMAHGAGRIVLCSAPLAFTNHNLLKDRNATFLAGALSVMPEYPVHWDEHLKVGRMEAGTPLRYILSQPALRWAWYLALALVALYMVLHARRRQRAIPVVKPPRNASRELLGNIGRLYWHQADHPDMARRMILHFKEEVKLRTHLRTFAYDQATFHHLAAKTGLPEGEVEQRLRVLEGIEAGNRMNEEQLLRLSNELHDLRQLL